ncbi:hypothetical protein [Streptomyces sp. CC216C]|uniref:hypothetical protein n=1 Tax=Streptomyces sp. CC216C TaxID=3044576 RepID=UPI0024A89569|nr:hypothetical protein [Streptomyces sp. CC216C]
MDVEELVPGRQARRRALRGRGEDHRHPGLDPRTGERVAKLRGQDSWPGSKRAADRLEHRPGGGGEYENRLVLVGVGSKKTISLSGARSPRGHSSKRWEPMFARS